MNSSTTGSVARPPPVVTVALRCELAVSVLLLLTSCGGSSLQPGPLWPRLSIHAYMQHIRRLMNCEPPQSNHIN